MMINKPTLRVGTSGIVVPGTKETRPEEFKDKSRLSYYGSLFNTLEMNSTFKKLPRTTTLERWSIEVPSGFQFTIKLWKEITHVKKLNINMDNIDSFMKGVNCIGNKKGSLLVQFPGSITSEYRKQVEQILRRLHKLIRKSEWKFAVEFRNVTWYDDKIFDLLNKYGSALVLQDMPNSNNLKADVPSRFAYFRFHGPKGDYRGSYEDEFLQEQTSKISALLNQDKDVYVYFNNTMGSALENAMRLKEMILRNR
jgi:uncharacterized protein YecE (DUF72 family)